MDKHETSFEDIDYCNDNEFFDPAVLNLEQKSGKEFCQLLEKYLDDGAITVETSGVTLTAEDTAKMMTNQSSFGQKLDGNFPDAEMSNYQLGNGGISVAQGKTYMNMNHQPSQNSLFHVVEIFSESVAALTAEDMANMMRDQSSFGQQLDGNFPVATTEMSNYQLGNGAISVAQGETDMNMNHLPPQNSLFIVAETDRRNGGTKMGRRNGGTKRARGCAVVESSKVSKQKCGYNSIPHRATVPIYKEPIDGSLSEEPQQKLKYGRKPIDDKPIPDIEKILTDRLNRVITTDNSAGLMLTLLYLRTNPTTREMMSDVDPVVKPQRENHERIKGRIDEINTMWKEGKISDDEARRLFKEVQVQIHLAFETKEEFISNVAELQGAFMNNEEHEFLKSKIKSKFPVLFNGQTAAVGDEGSSQSAKQCSGKRVNVLGKHLSKGKKKKNG